METKLGTLAFACTILLACTSSESTTASPDAPLALPDAPVAPVDPVKETAGRMIDEGRQTFRYDTFGDEAFWGDALHLHQAIAGAAHGGVGAGISPNAALGLGLKVDAEALPPAVVAAIQAGQVNLDDPASTLVLLQADAVVGVKGVFTAGTLTSVGIRCSLCHSTVDDSFAPGIGKRLDGWPNRDLDVGAIIAAAPNLAPMTALLGVSDEALRGVLHGWGRGKFDASVLLDGKTVGPNGSAAVLLPPAYGLAGVSSHTYTGWGSVTYWNAFVANLEMQGQGNFFDERLDDAARFPIAAANNFGHRTNTVDNVTSKLAALHFYQLALEPPAPAAGSFDAAAAARGATVFAGAGRCASCHVPPLYTEPGWNLHTPEELGIDDFQSGRSPTGRYRTAPLRGLWSRQKGGFYHDGRFATLADVVAHYDTQFALGLTAGQRTDLVAFLLSL
jgi:hypothetical protein